MANFGKQRSKFGRGKLQIYVSGPIADCEKLEHILRADSLTELSKLVFATRRVGVILACILWLVLNIAAQAGIAAVGLTYGFETASDGAILSTGNTSTADMQHFYPSGTTSIVAGANETYEDESYTAYL
jgi:hypothetical protein